MKDPGKVSGSTAGPAEFGVDVEQVLFPRSLEDLSIAGVHPGTVVRGFK